MTGRERSALYRLAVETGLRRGGLARLTRSSFELEGVDPAVLVRAGARNKYKNDRRVPLKIATAQLLKEHLGKQAASNAGICRSTQGTLRKDD